MCFFSILLQHRGTLVVDKPAGLSSEQRGPGQSVIASIRRRYPDAQLPHRLDRITSGVLVACMDRETTAAHNAAIATGDWGPKLYLARLAASTLPLGERKAYVRRRGKRAEVVRSGGKPSFLDVLCTAEAPGGNLDVLILLRTGRYHQLRCMLAHEGAPLLGDFLYGEYSPHEPLLCHAALGLPPFLDRRIVRSTFASSFVPEIRDALEMQIQRHLHS
ncbi:hypothetical protein CTAYLR_008421 [Chrysophaeum taylorii]|uniref:Pseudouridine synthase RsuA/RluA-like domain-containing protein n=1 Tax=Chrysophaeum taylorii TaxID=2483200 RepID=A0AAD7UJG6_9STRA|nr:hypothetical protein CTAYLR_008421 [Chrysophaeum taylorii]